MIGHQHHENQYGKILLLAVQIEYLQFHVGRLTKSVFKCSERDITNDSWFCRPNKVDQNIWKNCQRIVKRFLKSYQEYRLPVKFLYYFLKTQNIYLYNFLYNIIDCRRYYCFAREYSTNFCKSINIYQS